MTESPVQPVEPRAPTSASVALVTLSLLGVLFLGGGFTALQATRGPLVLPTAKAGELSVVVQNALLEAMAQHASVTFPLGVAQLLLGGALVLFATRALFGRRGVLGLLLQLAFANAGVVALGYALKQPLRADAVGRIVAARDAARAAQGSAAEGGLAGRSDLALVEPAQLWWTFRFELAMQLGTLGLCVLALSRPAVRAALGPAEDKDEAE